MYSKELAGNYYWHGANDLESEGEIQFLFHYSISIPLQEFTDKRTTPPSTGSPTGMTLSPMVELDRTVSWSGWIAAPLLESGGMNHVRQGIPIFVRGKYRIHTMSCQGDSKFKPNSLINRQ